MKYRTTQVPMMVVLERMPHAIGMYPVFFGVGLGYARNQLVRLALGDFLYGKLLAFLRDFKFTDIDGADKAIDWENARVITV